MLNTILFYIFVITGMINVIHFGLYLIGANVYDILKLLSESKARKQPRKKSSLVSVLIPAHNEETGIINTIESVRKSSYRKIEIIVVDDASTDKTRAIVRQYIKNHPKLNIKLRYKRKNVGKAMALNHVLRTSASGDFIMNLDADSLVGKRSIANAVKYFNDPNVAGVAANVRIIGKNSILGLLQKFEYMIGYRSKKFFTAANCEFVVGGVASTYRADVMKKVGFYDHDIITEDIALSLKIIAQNGNKTNRVVYGVDVIAMTEGVQTFKSLFKQRYRWKIGSLQSILKFRNLFGSTNKLYSKMLTFYRIPMAFLGELFILFEPLALIYVIEYCSVVGNISLIIGAYITISVYLSWNVVFDEYMNWTDKIKMIAYIPIMYFIMYIMNIIQLFAIIRCLFNYQKITRKVAMKTTWKSPERSGQPIPTVS